jgi:RNA polymerase sigma-70 factor (ECF subfamily)
MTATFRPWQARWSHDNRRPSAIVVTNFREHGHSPALAPRLRVVLDELTESHAAEPALTRPDDLQPGGSPPSGTAPGSDTASFENLYEQHFEFTWRVLRHLGLGGASVNDACQELWLVVHRRLPTIALDTHVRTWLFGVAVNVVRNQRRSAARRRCDPTLPASLAAPGLDPEAAHAARETWTAVQSFVEALDEEDRWIFVFNVIERMSANETALALGIEVDSVYQRVRTLRRALRKRLDR